MWWQIWLIRWTNPQGFNLLPLLPSAAPEPGLSLKLGRDHSDYLQSRLNVSTGPRPARNKGGSFKEPILRRLTLYKTNLQSDEDEPSPTRPFFLCRTLLRNWRWASVHLLQGAHTAHQVCARAHGTMRTWLKKSTLLHWLVASVWRMMMHIFMGRCPRSEDIAESPSDLFYCITALTLTARYGGATFRKPRFCKEAFHVFLLALYPLLQGVIAVQPPSLQLVLSIQSFEGKQFRGILDGVD